MVYRNYQAVYSNVLLATPKGSDNFRLMSGYREVNATIEQATFSVPTLESPVGFFAKAKAFCILDLLQEQTRQPIVIFRV